MSDSFVAEVAKKADEAALAVNRAVHDHVGDVFLGYQKTWVADNSQIKIGEKSRRVGLTWAEAADNVLAASLAKSEGGDSTYYIGTTKEMAQEFIEACAMWVRVFDKVAGEVEESIFLDEDENGDKEILTYTIRFPKSGFKIQALSSSPSNLRGRQGRVVIDEAAFHDRLDELIKAAIALTMWGSKVRIISTHNGVENLFNSLVEESRAGKRDYSVHRITIEDALNDGLYKRICLIRGVEWSQEAEDKWLQTLISSTATVEDAKEELYCEPKHGGGTYFARWLVESRMSKEFPVVRLQMDTAWNQAPEHIRQADIDDWLEAHVKPLLSKLDPTLYHAFGEDFARSGDLTIIAPMAIHKNLVRKAPFLVELRNIPFVQQEQILKYIVDRLPRLVGGKLDARGNGQYLAERAREKYGSQVIEEVMLSQGWYLENMPKFKSAFESDDIVIPQDQ
ncbi:MAG: terminase family protein, partial [Kangiella sp.]|nr:terminase family protein [Kangiella sp.]